jgi:peptide/nickel transport system substrate-binding protein
MKKTIAIVGVLTLGIGATLAVAPKNTFVIHNSGILTTFDPHQAFDFNTSNGIANTFETLVDFDKGTNNVVPLLATSWKVSNDGRTYTFVLRQNVKFHSGNIMTCKDAEYSFHRMLVTNNPSSPAFFLSDSMLGFAYWDEELIKKTPFSAIQKSVTCDANNQLVFKLTRRDPLFLMRATGTWASIIDQKFAVEQGEWDGSEATWKEWQGKDLNNSSLNKVDAGTGAYQMVSREADQAIFKAFAGYWGGMPKLENVIIKSVINDSSRVLAMKNGDADFITYSDRSVVSQLKNASGVSVLQFPGTTTLAGLFNQALQKGSKYVGSGKLDGQGIPLNFFADINVRRGFAAAFDRKRFIKEFFGGEGEDMTMGVPTGMPGYDPTITAFKFDPALAKREFAKAFKGQVSKNGFTFEAVILTDPIKRASMEMLRQNLSAINPKFRMKIRELPQNDLYAALGGNTVPLTVFGNSSEVPDALGQLTFFYSSSGTFAGHTHFKDAQIDKAIAELATTQDPTKRANLVRAVGRRAGQLVPILPFPYPYNTQIVRSSLKGFKETFNPYRLNSNWKLLSK